MPEPPHRYGYEPRLVPVVPPKEVGYKTGLGNWKRVWLHGWERERTGHWFAIITVRVDGTDVRQEPKPSPIPPLLPDLTIPPLDPIDVPGADSSRQWAWFRDISPPYAMEHRTEAGWEPVLLHRWLKAVDRTDWAEISYTVEDAYTFYVPSDDMRPVE